MNEQVDELMAPLTMETSCLLEKRDLRTTGLIVKQILAQGLHSDPWIWRQEMLPVFRKEAQTLGKEEKVTQIQAMSTSPLGHISIPGPTWRSRSCLSSPAWGWRLRASGLQWGRARLGPSQREQSEKRQQENQKKEHTPQTRNPAMVGASVWKGQMPSSELRSNSESCLILLWSCLNPFTSELLDQNVFPGPGCKMD